MEFITDNLNLIVFGFIVVVALVAIVLYLINIRINTGYEIEYLQVGPSYLRAKLKPKKEEDTTNDIVVNDKPVYIKQFDKLLKLLLIITIILTVGVIIFMIHILTKNKD